MSDVTSLTSASVLTRVRHALPELDHARIEKAFRMASELYGDAESDVMEEKQIEHACGVLNVLLEFCPDEDTIVACLLQHVLVNQRMSISDLEHAFGPAVREIVSCIHLLSHIQFHNRRRSIDDLKMMFVSISNDARVVVLKLCIRCYNLQNLDRVKPEERLLICRETLQLFAPVAARLGIYKLKHRLEDYAFPVVYPTDNERIMEQLRAVHIEHAPFLDAVASLIRGALENEKIVTRVEAREKHPYSIFQKMREKGLTGIHDVQDLYAARVIVPSDSDCYQALGLIHQLGTPMSHRFKDYISFPKPNGYKSLHTCLMRMPTVPHDLIIEIQIRTQQMHHEAEYGVAAHWSYKEKGSIQTLVTSAHLRHILQRQQLLSLDEAVKIPSNPEDLKLGLVDHIYVLTPHGDVIELPEGATPLDFAFSVHTDIGLSFRAAKVNGVVMPISHQLENGDVVEILTFKQPRPSFSWLEELRTTSARSKLKTYFAAKEREDFIVKGRELLNNALKDRGYDVLDPDLTPLKTFDGTPLNKKQREDVLVKIGIGAVKAASTFKHITLAAPRRAVTQPRRTVRQSRKQHIVEIEGGLKMPLRFAKCCSADAMNPLPEIRGFVTRTGDVMVHKHNCRMIKNANPERMVQVRWI